MANKAPACPRVDIGGQAVMEGVMMKSPSGIAMAVRDAKGRIVLDYKKFKTKVAKDMIETCEKALNISITPYIEEIEIALPPTFSRYLNTPLGTPYGYMLEKWDSMLPRTIQYMGDQPFDNFYFCGASQERGDGYGCAYYSGEKAAGIVIKKMKEGK